MCRRTIIIFLILFIFINIYGEGSRDSEIIQRNYSFSDFNSVLVNGSFRIRVINSEIWDVHISVFREDFRNIDIRKNKDILKLSMRSDRDITLPSPVVVISMPVIKKIVLSGMVQMEVGGFFINNERLEVSVGAGSFLNLNGIECANADFFLNGPCELYAFLSAESINVDSKGSSNIRMGGRAENLVINSNGRARIDGTLLLVDYINLYLVGINEIRITPDIQLTIESEDKSTIYYKEIYMDNPIINNGNAILKKY